MITKEKERLEKFPHQTDEGPSNLNSFCTVAFGRDGYEASLLMHSIRLHSNNKIYLMADYEGLSHLQGEMPENVDVSIISSKDMDERRIEYSATPSTIWANCPKREVVGNQAWLSYRMDVMAKAIKETGNTMFLDADVILINPINCNFKSELALSTQNGVCGGGYIYSNDPAFPENWRKLFKSDLAIEATPAAADQVCGKCGDLCTSRLHKHHDTTLFGTGHNYGPWRVKLPPRLESDTDQLLSEMGLSVNEDIYLDEGEGPEKLVSFHAHLQPKRGQRDSLYNLVRALYECLKRSLNANHRRLMNFINDIYIPNAHSYGLGGA